MSINDEDRFLIFKIGDDRLASPLFSISEIVEPLPIRAVPNHHDYFLGLANLRGQLVGVLDLGKRFGLKPVANAKEGEGVFLIIDVDGSLMAGFVSSVESVIAIPSTEINKACNVEIGIPPEALGGIANIASTLLLIVDLPQVMKSA